MDVGLDAEAVVGAVEGEVADEDIADATEGFRADGHAVAGVEVIFEDAHVIDAGAAALDGDVVVAGADEGVRDGDVRGAAAGVDAVGVAGVAGCVDADAPDGEAFAVAVGDVEVGGVLEGDAV